MAAVLYVNISPYCLLMKTRLKQFIFRDISTGATRNLARHPLRRLNVLNVTASDEFAVFLLFHSSTRPHATKPRSFKVIRTDMCDPHVLYVLDVFTYRPQPSHPLFACSIQVQGNRGWVCGFVRFSFSLLFASFHETFTLFSQVEKVKAFGLDVFLQLNTLRRWRPGGGTQREMARMLAVF